MSWNFYLIIPFGETWRFLRRPARAQRAFGLVPAVRPGGVNSSPQLGGYFVEYQPTPGARVPRIKLLSPPGGRGVLTNDLELFTTKELINELMQRKTFLGIVVHSEEELK